MSLRRSTRSSSAGAPQAREVKSSIHPQRLCHPCILCNRGKQSKYFHPKSWKDPVLLQLLQQYEPTLDIEDYSCICRQCTLDVKKLRAGDPSFVPRWRKSTKTDTKCYINWCMSAKAHVTKVVDLADLLSFFSCDQEDTAGTTNEVPLCIEHYNDWYSYNHPESHSHLKCKTCYKYIDQSDKSRSIPEPELLQPFLLNNTDFQGSLSPDDRVCYACYKSHLATVKHIKQSVKSTDSDLQHLNTTVSLPLVKYMHTNLL